MGTRLTTEQRKAFAEMLRPHHQYLARFCRHLMNSDQDGQDLYQQAILKGLAKFGTLKKPNHFRQWLCAIIVNEHRTHCRKERLRQLFILPTRHNNDHDGLPPPNSQGDPYDVVQTIRLKQCLARLSAKKREALLLFEVEGFPLAEIAGIQRCSVDAVKTRVSRARKELRRLFLDGRPIATARPAAGEKDHALYVGLETLE